MNMRKLLSLTWIVLGIIDVADGIYVLLNDPTNFRYFADFFFGGFFILLGVYMSRSSKDL